MDTDERQLWQRQDAHSDRIQPQTSGLSRTALAAASFPTVGEVRRAKALGMSALQHDEQPAPAKKERQACEVSWPRTAPKLLPSLIPACFPWSEA